MKRLCYNTKNITIEDKIKQMDDIVIHKKLVIDAIYKLAKNFFNNNNDDLALKLMDRAFNHDNSKILNDEFFGMAEFVNDIGALTNSDKQISDNKQNAINFHWDRNSHHPEYWTDISQMEDIDILEMCADWYARSIQFGTDLMEFIEKRQKNRFNFPIDIYDKILKYCKLLIELK